MSLGFKVKGDECKADPNLSSVLHVCGHSNAADLMDVIFSESLSVGWAPAVVKHMLLS